MNSEDNEHASCAAAEQLDRKRAAAKKLIQRYYYQLTNGCGNPNCQNECCASSGKIQKLTPDQAAVQALQLFSVKAKLCETNSPKVAKLSQNKRNHNCESSSSHGLQKNPAGVTSMDLSPIKDNSLSHIDSERMMDIPMDEVPGVAHPSTSDSKTGNHSDKSSTPPGNEESYLTEAKLLEIIEKCRETNSYSSLIRTLGHVFFREDLLKNSFQKDSFAQVSKENLTKEDIRAMEIDQDKDHDSQELQESEVVALQEGVDPPAAAASSATPPSAKSLEPTVDIASVRRAFSALFAIPSHPFQSALINALTSLCENLEVLLRYHQVDDPDPKLLNIFLIIMEIPTLECDEYLETALPAYCKAAACLPVHMQAQLARTWSKESPEQLKQMVNRLHQLITVRVIKSHFSRDCCINDEESIIAATKVMKILYYANILGGEKDRGDLIAEETELNEAEDTLQDLLQGAVGRDSKEPKQTKEDPLSQELEVRTIDCRKPVIPFEEFYNEPLSDQLEVDRDFAYYKTDGGKFSFMNYSFILTPAIKSLGLYYDNRIRMYSERRFSVLQSLVHGSPPNPYLRLRVRRDHIVDDALIGLEMVAMENPNNLKKQLVVEFEGEQGIDEGGISKEFFQLIVDEIFNPDYAMFTLNPETQTYWFNPTSFESDGQFTLIGIILGLAIYNNVILDVHFPMVVWRKLLGKKGTYWDLEDWNPTLARGLHELLVYDQDDIEEVFMQTFRISYQDVFGTVLTHDLKENGDQILVNHSNKQEFVDLHAEFLLNKSVERQFRAFRRGFLMVTDDSPLKMLFRPEEVELLVCGSKNFDFNALEEATEYDGGYTVTTPIIKAFWELVHEFSLEYKRKLLQFATGSDRVPVGGLSKLKFVIARHGPDSDRLPTAHTCFNVLLLPEYSSKEKLQERLLKAINYSKGFGML